MLHRIALVGTGRMGSLIRTTAAAARTPEDTPVFEVVACLDGSDADAMESAAAADVLIDFSHASCLAGVAAYVTRCRCALVSGTTGYTPEQAAELRALGADVPVVWSGNYSIGVAALRHLVAQATRELPGFDVEIVECHHNRKADAPSGTASMLVDAVQETRASMGLDALSPVFGREGLCGPRAADEIGVHAVRGGTVAGVHTVGFFGPDEEITLTHRAASRQIFVNGALAAAVKLVERPAGFYTFDALMFG